MPGGIDYAEDPTKPYYSCNAYDAQTLVSMTQMEWDKGLEYGLNANNANNKVAACLNYNNDEVPGLYGCRMGLLRLQSYALTLSVASIVGLISLI